MAPRRRLHLASGLVFVIVILITAVLVIVAQWSIYDSKTRALAAQSSEVSAAISSSIPSIEAPLTAAARVAVTTQSIDAFNQFASAEVGAKGAFRSVSLWRVTSRGETLLSNVGSTPAIAPYQQTWRTFVRLVADSEVLRVTDILGSLPRALGYAVAEPNGESTYVVYGEIGLSPGGYAKFPPGSAFGGLSFAMYYGAIVSKPALIESTVQLPFTGRTSTEIVPYADHVVTAVTTLGTQPDGTLPPQVPLLIALAGLLAAILAVIEVERTVSRREAAETLAVDTGMHLATQRAVATTLQRALLPEEGLSFPGLEIAARHMAGGQDLEVGGDWYDTVAMGSDHLFVTVGDVSGRGLEAARVMGPVRHAARAYATQGDRPEVVLRKLGELVDSTRDGCFVTVLCLSIDVRQGVLEVASAGHLPPVVVGADGAQVLEVPVSPPIGVRFAGERMAASVALERDDVVLAFTDGLVERRDSNIDDDLGRLVDVAASSPREVEALLDNVLAQLGRHGADDLAVVAAKYLGDHVHELVRGFEPVEDAVGAARRFALDAAPGLTREQREVLALLVSELATNCVQHAAVPFTVSVVDSGPVLRVEVTDSAGGHPQQRSPEGSEARGRGLLIVDALVSRWGTKEDAVGTLVWFELDHDGAPTTP